MTTTPMNHDTCGARYPPSLPLSLSRIETAKNTYEKRCLCCSLATISFSGFLINSRPTSGLLLRLASAPSRLDLTDDRLSIGVRSASDGSAVIIILLFALRLRSDDVLDAYFVAWYLYLYLYVVVSIPYKRSNSRELAHILAFNKKLALKRRVERDLCAALASSCCLGI